MSAGTIRYLLSSDDQQLVKRTAAVVYRRYRGREDLQLREELYHCGIVGLIEARKGFDPDQGIPFAAFAVHRIRGAMIDYLRSAPLIRLPQRQQEQRRELEQAREQLRQQGRPESETELSALLGWPLPEVRRVAALQPGTVSLSEPNRQSANHDDGLIPPRLAGSSPGPEARALKQELAAIVQSCLENIRSARDRLILVGRVLHDHKLRELAERFDCSLETVRLRQQQALASMRRCLERHGWDGDSLGSIKG